MRWMTQKFRFFRALWSLVKENPREFRFSKRQLGAEIVFNWWVCNIIPRSMVLFQWVKSLKLKVKLNNQNPWAWAVWALFHSTTRVKFNKLETFSKSHTYQAFLASKRSIKRDNKKVNQNLIKQTFIELKTWVSLTGPMVHLLPLLLALCPLDRWQAGQEEIIPEQ